MRRLSIALAFAAVATLAVAMGAQAKGPSAAVISGPGLPAPLELSGNGESGDGALGALTLEGGFFQTSFGQSPNPLLPKRPADLGPRYSVDYTVPGPNSASDHILQDLYPYAANGPVTYMTPGQRFFGAQHTIGGWYRGTSSLKQSLVAAGLPATPPAEAGDEGGIGVPLFVVMILTVAVLGVGATVAVRGRRRLHSVG